LLDSTNGFVFGRPVGFLLGRLEGSNVTLVGNINGDKDGVSVAKAGGDIATVRTIANVVRGAFKIFELF
jgi:hypothetical protein